MPQDPGAVAHYSVTHGYNYNGPERDEVIMAKELVLIVLAIVVLGYQLARKDIFQYVDNNQLRVMQRNRGNVFATVHVVLCCSIQH